MITTDPAPLNEIINHPDVLPGHFPDGDAVKVDVTATFDRGGFGSVGNGYGFVFDPVVAGVYEVHSSVLPAFRGKSRRFAARALYDAFVETDCLDVVTRVKNNPPALGLARSVGMRPTFKRNGYQFLHININQWAAGSELLPQGDEERYTAIAEAMKKHGNARKADWFYNLWARLTGRWAAANNTHIKKTPQGVEVI